jgi:hypothetical protein
MSALTIVRRPGTNQALDLILTVLKSHRFEGSDAVKVLYELHESLESSLYLAIGSVDLECVADEMHREIKNFESEAPGDSLRDLASCWPLPAELDALTIRRVGV